MVFAPRQTVPRRRHVGCFHFLGSLPLANFYGGVPKVEEATGVARPLDFAAGKVCRWSPPYHDVRQRQTHQIRIPLARYRSYLPYEFTSSAADFGHKELVSGGGNRAGACAHGILKFFTTKWLIMASTPASRSIPFPCL
ncbi:hypothetical protein LXL04_006846 [Taraxacum kok-saghyz]